MAVLTGLSGNEMYCLRQVDLAPGNLVVGNSVFALGFIRSIGSGLKTIVGGEVNPITKVIHDGRQSSYLRMMQEVKTHGGAGVTGVSSDLIFHGTNVEFLSIGSTVHVQGVQDPSDPHNVFSASADGQELYCQMDCGFHPIQFVFGNVAYSIGLGGGVMGLLRSLVRGEVKEFSDIFHTTRHRALERISAEAHSVGANAVLGIQTTIVPIGPIQEMVMIGTAAHHPLLPATCTESPLTSDLTNEEMWNVIQMGYVPVKLVLGVSVFSIGFIGGLTAFFKGWVRGEISELTTLIYDARENALAKIAEDVAGCDADDVVGIKTYVYDLGGGLIELMAIGTAVKKQSNIHPSTPNLMPQAIIKDKDTFVNMADPTLSRTMIAAKTSLNDPTRTPVNPRVTALVVLFICFYIYTTISAIQNSSKHRHHIHYYTERD